MSSKNTSSYAIPALIYALLIGTTFSPDVRPVMVAAFGDRPFGLPVAPVVAACVAILVLPFVFGVYHFMLIAERAASDGHGLGKISLLAYAATVGRRHPELRRSQLLSLTGLVYFVLLCAAWIFYADSKGI